MKRKTLILIVLVALAGIAMALFRPTYAPRIGGSLPSHTWGSGAVWKLEVADDMFERSLGLGGRDALPAGQAMLFLFESPAAHAFWMKGMRFPLDMVFLRGGEVVMVERGITPESGEVVTPSEPIDQVLEMNAGEAESIEKGDHFLYFKGL